jgi:hypothetical protein
MCKQEPCVDDVKGFPDVIGANIGNAKLHVADSQLFGFATGEIEVCLIYVDTQDAPARTNVPAHLECRISSAAADIQASHSIGKSQTGKKRAGAGVHDARKKSETFSTFDPAPHHVVILFSHFISLKLRRRQPQNTTGRERRTNTL